MLRQVFKVGIIYGISGIVSGGAIFMLMPFYTRLFSVDDYGVYEYLTIIGSLFAIVVALEVAQGIARYTAETRHDSIQLRVYASTGLWFTVTMYLLSVLAVGLFKDFLSVLVFGDVRHSSVLLAATVSFGFAGVQNLLVNQLRWELRPYHSALLSFFNTICSISISIALVWSGMGLIGAFLGPVVSGLITIPVGVSLTRESFGFRFSKSALKEMLGYSIPLVFSSMGWLFSNYLDRLAIKELLTLHDLGIYGVGFRIASMTMLLTVGLEGAVSPIIFANYKKAETSGKTAILFRFVVAIGMVLCAFLSIFSAELLIIFATSAYKDSALVIPFLAASILLARFNIFAPGLGLAKKTILLAGINIAMGALNLGLNYLMIPIWGIMGAAAATLVSASATFGVVMFFSQRYYPVPHRFGPLVLMTGSGLAIMLLAVWGQQVHDIGLLARVCAFLSLLVPPFLFGVVSRDELREAMRMAKERMGRMP